MDELHMLAELRRDTPPIRAGASGAARARLLEEMTAPSRSRVRLRPIIVRAGVVAALASAIITAIAVPRDTGGDPARPGVVAVLAGAQPAVAAVAKRARTAAEKQSTEKVPADSWTYVRTLQRETESHDLSDLRDWYTADGRWNAGVDDDGRVTVSEIDPERDVPSAAFLLGAPTEPEGMARHVYAEVDRIIAAERAGGIRSSTVDTSRGRDVAAFALVKEALKRYYVTPRQQAALYGALAYIPGVTVIEDVEDAAGRHGQAFGIIDAQSVRSEIVFDRRTYRYLGSRSVFTEDYTESPPPPGVDSDYDPDNPLHFAKGTVVELTAKMDAAVVDGPGQRP
ncbi:CU044_5270 family protein [Planotetraspora mira]|uniref:CU044_5270 family protein n=1 Tax=Planotetraspora mira TaxID=58121 RepID=A0A8J3XAU0_9ACTN|nr:CU044_5270 family protein [Planotetraspora mira]GII29838.1 hypothetical protein Pmi06nite_32800 [Planotetraspora mira]